MATISSHGAITPNIQTRPRHAILKTNYHHKTYKVACKATKNPRNNTTSQNMTEPENLLLRAAWYGSELLGIAASVLCSPSKAEAPQGNAELAVDESGALDRATVVDTIKEDFERSYFVTDPAGSFRGLRRFKRNCTNFGSLIEKSNMKLTKWEDFQDKGIGHWRFSCIMSFPWKPILSATGYTEYFFDEQSGKVCRHVEHWNVPKMALLKQLLRPSKRFWWKRGGS